MSNIITLTSVLLKNNLLGGTSKNHSTRNKKDKSAIVYAIILIAYFLIFSVPIVFVLKDLLANYDFSELILSFIVPFGGVTSLIFAFFSITSVFYFNKDSETLLPLPIKSSELLIAKFLTSLLSEYFILLMFIFPIIFGVGMGINASATYYLYAAGICALMPVVPSVIVSIIIMLLNIEAAIVTTGIIINIILPILSAKLIVYLTDSIWNQLIITSLIVLAIDLILSPASPHIILSITMVAGSVYEGFAFVLTDSYMVEVGLTGLIKYSSKSTSSESL